MKNKEFKCLICKYMWKDRVGVNPKACTRCKRYDWNKKVEEKNDNKK